MGAGIRAVIGTGIPCVLDALRARYDLRASSR